MNILVNGSGLKIGGGLQVANSICSELYKFQHHRFFVVLSSHLKETIDKLDGVNNVVRYIYDSPTQTLKILLLGRDDFLDEIVEKNNIDVVFSFFGPILWKPRVPHLEGFARAHIIMRESPYFQRMSFVEKIGASFFNRILTYFFARSAHYYYTENRTISERFKKLVKDSEVFTITNYYNQVFDNPKVQVEKKLPVFDGCTILSVSAPYPHKNLPISIKIAEYLKNHYPDFNFRFVFTIEKTDFPDIDTTLTDHFLFLGAVSIEECPSLYRQCNLVFQPTLLECFTATYPEAMRMRKPIITTDLEFARGLCKNAAAYYDPEDYKQAAETIVKLSKDKDLRDYLVKEGEKQLATFDTYEARAAKIIHTIEHIYALEYGK